MIHRSYLLLVIALKKVVPCPAPTTLSLLSVKEEERAAKIAAEEDNDRVSALKKMEKEGLAQFSVLSIFSSPLDRSFVRRK